MMGEKSLVKSGSVLGGTLLIAGSCIGAGMLALPVVTGIAGFVPSIFFFLIAWAFMATTGMLLLEANLAMGHHLSLISLAERTLGKTGKVLCWILFIFLFYSLNVAYLSASGSMMASLAADLFHLQIPNYAGNLLFTLFFGAIVLWGTGPVDYVNRLLMVGLIITYTALVFLGSQHLNLSYLKYSSWGYALGALPILVISFGFHNMIPSLAHYFQGDRLRLRRTVFLGSALPLVIYLIWEFVLLALIPVEGRNGLLHALDKGEAASAALREVVGLSSISLIAQLFGLFAIVTSFLAQALSLVDFLADGLRLSRAKGSRLFLVLLTILPPCLLALLYPGLFIKALNLAGGTAAVILFGVMPAMMVWVIRYKKHSLLPPLMPWGRTLLLVILCVALSIFAIEVCQELGLSLLPS